MKCKKFLNYYIPKLYNKERLLGLSKIHERLFTKLAVVMQWTILSHVYMSLETTLCRMCRKIGFLRPVAKGIY